MMEESTPILLGAMIGAWGASVYFLQREQRREVKRSILEAIDESEVTDISLRLDEDSDEQTDSQVEKTGDEVNKSLTDTKRQEKEPHLSDAPAGEAAASDTERCIYLDYNGTTPIYDEVLEAMMPFFTTSFGNPSSGHFYGKHPRAAVNQSRREILKLLGNPNGDLSSIWFTSCGTEADNLAIHLALQANSNLKRPHVVTSNVEHPAIIGALRALERRGLLLVTEVPVQPDGRVLADDIMDAIQPNTVLVTVMYANNESGALQPVKEIAERCRSQGILFHTDAAQAAGKVSVSLDDLGEPDMISLVGHKFGAPKGIACLYVRTGCLNELGREIHNEGVLLIGGAQEHGRRGGTENVPYIVGMGVAARMALESLEANAEHCEELRKTLIEDLVQGLGRDNVLVHGPTSLDDRLPNTLSVGIRDSHSGSVLSAVGNRVAASAGATCHSTESISSVLRAMKVPVEFARGTLRLSCGPKTTGEEIRSAAAILVEEVKKQLN